MLVHWATTAVFLRASGSFVLIVFACFVCVCVCMCVCACVCMCLCVTVHNTAIAMASWIVYHQLQKTLFIEVVDCSIRICYKH